MGYNLRKNTLKKVLEMSSGTSIFPVKYYPGIAHIFGRNLRFFIALG